jgi:glycosyltransferase involved in cell wall biosynthesis
MSATIDVFTIDVLMSAFNGRHFLERHITSILNQTVSVKLFARDDGSTDGGPALPSCP